MQGQGHAETPEEFVSEKDFKHILKIKYVFQKFC